MRPPLCLHVGSTELPLASFAEACEDPGVLLCEEPQDAVFYKGNVWITCKCSFTCKSNALLTSLLADHFSMCQKLILSFSTPTLFSVATDLEVRDPHLILQLFYFSFTPLIVNASTDDPNYPLIPSAVILLLFLYGVIQSFTNSAGFRDVMAKLKILPKRVRKKEILACRPGFLEPFRCLNPVDSQVFGNWGFNYLVAHGYANLIVIQPGYTNSGSSVFPCKVAPPAP